MILYPRTEPRNSGSAPTEPSDNEGDDDERAGRFNTKVNLERLPRFYLREAERGYRH